MDHNSQQAIEIERLHKRIRELESAEGEWRRAEKILMELETRWEFALESSGDGIWDWNAQTNQVFYSRQWKSMLGYTDHEIGDTLDEWKSRVHLDDLADVIEKVKKLLNQEVTIYISEHRVRCKDGSYKWILDRGKVVEWTEDHRPLRIIGTHSNITNRKEIESALRASEAKYRSVVNTLGEGIILQGEDGQIITYNQALKDILDLGKNEIVQTPMFEQNWEITREDGGLFPLEQLPSVVTLTTGIPQHDVVMGIQKLGGTKKWVSTNSRPIWQKNGSKLEYVVSSFIEITEQKFTENALHEALYRYQSLFEQSHDAVFILDLEGRHKALNHRAAEMLGYSVEELMQLSLNEISAEVEKSVEVLDRLLKGEHIPIYERLFRRKDGSIIPVEINVEIIHDTKGNPLHVQSEVRDITERKQAEELLRQSEMRYRIVAENTYDWEFWQSPDGKFQYISPSCASITRHKSDEFIQNPGLLLQIIYEQDREKFIAHQHNVISKEISGELEFRIVLPDGTIRWLSHACQPVFDGMGTYLGVRGNNRDITGRKGMEDALQKAYQELQVKMDEVVKLQVELREQALHDPLTGMHNRRYLDQILERELARVQRQKKHLSVIIMDIDHFKKINDTYGHQVGDEFLKEIANMIGKFTRTSDICCRYGGEEFLLVMPEATARSAAKRANELREKCAAIRIAYEGKPLKVTLSFGVATFPAHGRESKELLINADKALYRSKRNGRNTVTVWEQ